jgi:hypothetical protein
MLDKRNGGPIQKPRKAKKWTCPFCSGADVRRSQMRGLIERGVFRLVGLRAYRCNNCDERFYRFGASHERPAHQR